MRTGEATAKRCKESKHKTGSALNKLWEVVSMSQCEFARKKLKFVHIYIYIYIEIAAVFFSSVHSFKQHEAAGLNLEKLDQV